MMAALALAAASGLIALGAPAGGPVRFTDVAEQSGLDFQHVSGSSQKRYILESMGGGVAWIDFDRDGCVDLYLVNAGRWQDLNSSKRSVRNALYRNNCDGTFSDVTGKAGLAGAAWGMGAAVADFDNDGRDDIYLCNYGPNALYRNRGDGTFQDVASAAGVDHPGWGSSAAWADFDSDGHLDLYVANYLHFDKDDPPAPACAYRTLRVQCGPKGLAPESDVLYRSRGDGTFQKVPGMEIPASFGLGAVWGDYDNDGDPDLYVANDGEPNFLFRNGGDGSFQEMGLLSGAAFNEDGHPQAGMGVDFGDYDRDGRLDLYVTNYSDDYNTLYHNSGTGQFRDATHAAGIGHSSWRLLGWGTGFFDYDNDGWLDLFVANGHVFPQVDSIEIGTSYAQPKLLYRNRGGGFEDATEESGPDLAVARTGRGVAYADYDNDGDLDIAVNNLDGRVSLYRNEGGNKAGHWLQLTLLGLSVGARVTLVSEAKPQIREIRAGSSYQSSHDSRVHFGLGAATEASFTVRWPDGKTQSFQQVAVGKRYFLKQGENLTRER